VCSNTPLASLLSPDLPVNYCALLSTASRPSRRRLSHTPTSNSLRSTSFRSNPGRFNLPIHFLAVHSQTSGYFSHSLLYNLPYAAGLSSGSPVARYNSTQHCIECPALPSPCSLVALSSPADRSCSHNHNSRPAHGAHPRAICPSMSTAATANSSSNALNPAASNPGRPLKMSSTGKALDAPRKPGSPVDAGQR
jgi:hypothetical protein